MTEARPKPLVGAILGLILGLLTMALLTVLGVLPPDRLPLFGIVGLAIIAVSAILTQRLALAKGRLITVIVVGALLGGVALTGIPEIVRGGSLNSMCTATATSSLEAEPVSPSGTTAVDPFRVTPTDTIVWTTVTESPVTEARASLSVMVGGFEIPLRNATFAEAPDLTEWSGETLVEGQLEGIHDATGMLVTGTHHLAASVDTDAGECQGNAYVLIEPRGTFDGLLLVLLWSLLGVVLVTIAVLAIVVRRSISNSDATLAMVGTSAIPGGTSTTPPPAPRRAAPTEEPAEASGTRDTGGRSGADSAGSDRTRGGADASTSRAEKTGPSARSEEGVAPTPQEEAAAPEAMAEEPPGAEDGLARSPYASPEFGEGTDPDSAADAAPLEETEPWGDAEHVDEPTSAESPTDETHGDGPGNLGEAPSDQGAPPDEAIAAESDDDPRTT